MFKCDMGEGVEFSIFLVTYLLLTPYGAKITDSTNPLPPFAVYVPLSGIIKIPSIARSFVVLTLDTPLSELAFAHTLDKSIMFFTMYLLIYPSLVRFVCTKGYLSDESFVT